MKLKHISIFVLGLIILSSFTFIQQNETSSTLKLITTQTTYEAGSSIFLKFSNPDKIEPYLYISNSYGSLLIKPIIENNIISYEFPKAISNKTGIIHWKLINTNLSGKISITPIQEAHNMETYIGPPSIQAGNKDFSMLTVIPTDYLDNPLAENTLITTKDQFLNKENSNPIYTKNSIAYKKIYAPLQSGRMLISSNCLGYNSKEFTVIVHPENPTDFKISAERNHFYADGNQITTFYSSVIKDEFKNIVSDGTLVSFFIKNEKGNTLKTTGTTIKGVATSKMIHPDYETTWNIKAYINGLAESNTITINYKQAIKDFEVNFLEKNRTIQVGPLQSFMEQKTPDGLEVNLLVYKNKKLIDAKTETSYNGFVSFKLNTAIYPKDTYDLKIKTAGLEKDFKQLKIW